MYTEERLEKDGEERLEKDGEDVQKRKRQVKKGFQEVIQK